MKSNKDRRKYEHLMRIAVANTAALINVMRDDGVQVNADALVIALRGNHFNTEDVCLATSVLMKLLTERAK